MIHGYKLHETIGKGTFGVVKRAAHDSFGTVAVKIIQKENLRNKEELCVLSALNHPSIVKVLDLFEQEEQVFIVMEHITGGDLFEHIQSFGPVSEVRARAWFRDIICAVEFMHSNLVVHRDLKLENIMLTPMNTIKITDFGFGRFVKPGKRMNSWCGSPVYVAPEVSMRNPYTPKAEVWSLGIVLYALVTGCLPWGVESDSRLQNAKAYLEGRFKFPSNMYISPELKSLIRAMIQPNPEERIAVHDIITHRWVNEGYPTIPFNARTDYSPINELNEFVLNHMTMMGYDRVSVEVSLLRGDSKPLLALYNHLVSAHKRNTELNHKTISIQKLSQISFANVRRFNSETESEYTSRPLRSVNVDHVYEKLKEIGKEKYILFLIELDLYVQFLNSGNLKEAQLKDIEIQAKFVAKSSEHSIRFAQGLKISSKLKYSKYSKLQTHCVKRIRELFPEIEMHFERKRPSLVKKRSLPDWFRTRAEQN